MSEQTDPNAPGPKTPESGDKSPPPKTTAGKGAAKAAEAPGPVLLLPYKQQDKQGVLSFPYILRDRVDQVVAGGRVYQIEAQGQWNPHTQREEHILKPITLASKDELAALKAAGWTQEG